MLKVFFDNLSPLAESQLELLKIHKLNFPNNVR
jgi:hypothetical protein